MYYTGIYTTSDGHVGIKLIMTVEIFGRGTFWLTTTAYTPIRKYQTNVYKKSLNIYQIDGITLALIGKNIYGYIYFNWKTFIIMSYLPCNYKRLK